MKTANLKSQTCEPCEKGTPALTPVQAKGLLRQLPGWMLNGSKKEISKAFKMKDFPAAVKLINTVAKIAQQQDHHPDVHLTGYRNLEFRLFTHSIGGLSKNDFILASKIERLPKSLKRR